MELQLVGQKVVFKSKADDETTREVVHLVEAKIKEAERRMKSKSAPHHVAVLALLDMAEDFVQARRRVVAERSEIRETIERMENSMAICMPKTLGK